MNTCDLNYIGEINAKIDAFFFVEKKDFSLSNLEKYVKEKIPALKQDFSLETYIVNSKEFRESFEDTLNMYNVPMENYVKNLESTSVKTKSNITTNFSSINISDLFHTLPLAKSKFEGDLHAKIIKEIIIGGKDSIKYVSSNEEINTNLSNLKNDLFKSIQKFLIDEEKLTGKIEDLYDENMDLVNYPYYRKVMTLLDDYFFSNENYPKIKTYSGKRIPNLTMDIGASGYIFEAYNAGVLLSNFDSVLQEYYSGILDINYNLFNNLRTNTGENKYTLKIEGLKTEYFKRDGHESEGSETSESKLVKLIISTIPIFNKKNEKMG